MLGNIPKFVTVAIVAAILIFDVRLANAQLDEITVTATKRETTAQDTALALTVLDGATLDLVGIQDVASLASQIPSLVMGNDNNDWKATLRGVGSDNVDINAEPGVALHVDGVYLARPAGFNALTYDIERVEVLRGPQGTLYGRNATGGAINVLSKAPEHEFSASADILYGDYDRVRARGALNMPLIDDKLAFRLSAIHEDRDGYQNNVNPDGEDGNDADDFYYRAQLLWDISDDSSITVRYSDLDRGGVGTARYRMPTPPDSTAPLGDFTPDYDDRNKVFKDHPEARQLDHKLWSGEGNFTLQSAELNVSMGYSKYDLVMTQDGDMTTGTYPQPGSEDNFSIRLAAADEFVTEIRLNSLPGSAFDWLVGVFYMEEDAWTDLDVRLRSTAPPFITFPPFSNPPGTPGRFSRIIDNTSTVQTESMAVFADFTFELSDSVELTAGVRVTEDEQSGVGITRAEVTNFFSEPPPTWHTISSGNVPAKDSWNKTTWKLGLNWDIDEDKLMYATVSTGFRSGGFNFGQADPDLLFYEPEDLTAIEVGSKNVFNDGKVQLNFSAFYYDYQDLQVFQLINDAAFVQNAAEAEIMGLETEFVFQITDSFSIDGHASFLDAEYTDFVSEDQLYPFGPDAIPGSGDELYDLTGNNLVQAPETSGLIGLSYDTEFASGAELTLRAQIYAQSEIYMRQFNLDPWDRQDSYTKTNLSFRFDSASDNWHLYGGVDNLEDEDVIANIDVTPGGSAFANVRSPRTWYMGLGVDF